MLSDGQIGYLEELDCIDRIKDQCIIWNTALN